MQSSLIYVIDDNKEFRESIRWVLEGEGHSVISIDDPLKGLSQLQNNLQETNCCCLLDIRMPDMTGLEFHEKLLKNGVNIPIIYMTGHGDIPLAVEAMSKGAITFLEKPIDYKLLNTAITGAFSAFNNSNQCNKSADIDIEYEHRLNLLTSRESEVLTEIVSGKMNKVIALDLGISVKTVELHRSRVMNKMQAKTAADLVKMVIRESVN
ncbi:MAG: response regulator [Candidatus Thiodiazotropha endolucinida]|nr:response regulator [Candidatus Thiodiazotropha taylori]MCW4312827.1 response regulator [Candidatus Thiodiazotropha taylori]